MKEAASYSFKHREFLQLQCFLELPLVGLFLPRCLHMATVHSQDPMVSTVHGVLCRHDGACLS